MLKLTAVILVKTVSVIAPRCGYRLGRLACFAGLCFLVTACDGGNSAGSTDSVNSSETASGNQPAASSKANGDDMAAESQRSPGEQVEYDVAALPTTALNAALLSFTQRQVDRPTIDAVVDTCAVLSTSEVDAMVADAARRHALGQQPTFTATTRGAACDYRSDTHQLTLLVGSIADLLSDNLADGNLFVPPGAGDITATAWDGDATIQILSEDSFGLNTAYAATTVVGDFGLRVDNSGGTGIDYSASGELFAELARAAIANVGSAAPPSLADESQVGTAVVGDPCSIWTAAELEAFLFGTPFGNPNDSAGPNSCAWDGWNRDGASLSLQVLNPDDTYSTDILVPVGSTGGTYTFQGGGLPIVVVIDDVARATLRIDMLDGSVPDQAVIALAENLFVRLAGR